jgi:hypothetical protein
MGIAAGGADAKITLETSGEDAKLHSKRVEKICTDQLEVPDREGRGRGDRALNLKRDNLHHLRRPIHRDLKTTLETSGENVNIHSKRVENTNGRWLPQLWVGLPCINNYRKLNGNIGSPFNVSIDLKLTVVLDYCEAMKLTVVLDHY